MRGLAGSAQPGKCVSRAAPPVFLSRDARQPRPSPHTHPCFRDDLARLRPRRTPFASDHVARAVCACALHHFRPAHWKRRRRRLRRRRRVGLGEEGAAREARRGGAGRCGLRGTLTGPPRPALPRPAPPWCRWVAWPERGDMRPVSPRGADVAASWRRLSCRAAPREPMPAVPGQLPEGAS